MGNASSKARAEVRRQGTTPIIPTKATERGNPHFDRPVCRQRNKVERLVNRLTEHRKISILYRKLGAQYDALIIIDCMLPVVALATRP